MVRESIIDTRGGTNTEGRCTVDDDDSCVERGGDGGLRERNNGEIQHGMVMNNDDVAMSTTPSVGEKMMNRVHDRGSARECVEVTKCVINEDRRCITHDCGTSKWVDDEHGWGCDGCYLCLTSKQSYDLHVLEHHPDSTNYIRDHIPDATKKLFTADQRHDG